MGLSRETFQLHGLSFGDRICPGGNIMKGFIGNSKKDSKKSNVQMLGLDHIQIQAQFLSIKSHGQAKDLGQV